MEYLQEHWLEGVAALHVLALIVVNLTPTPRDNEWLMKAYGLAQLFTGLITKKSKDTL